MINIILELGGELTSEQINLADLNQDGIIDVEDFKRAVYPEHKAYIRDWILSHQFDRNKYLDINQDGKVDMDDYSLTKDDSQKRAIQD